MNTQHNFQELCAIHATVEAGERFQENFARFVAEHKHDIIVETGYGISTLFLLKAIKPEAKVFSIDPNAWYGHIIEHPQAELIQQMSYDAMLPLFLKTGGWDFFLHDSNHEIKCQTYELELAYACLNPGGYIACDDYTWNNHNAWHTFTANHDLKPFNMGSIMLAQKPKWIPVFPEIERYEKECMAVAIKAEADFLKAGGKNSEVNWVR